VSGFSSLIKNKNVLFLGPAPHILDSKNTKDFHKFDVVVKLNKMVEQAIFSSEELNNRNDVLYHCLQIDHQNGDNPYSVEDWVKRNTKHLRIPFVGPNFHYRKNINRFLQLNQKFHIDHSFCSVREFNLLEKKCDGTQPSTGIIAINDLLLQKPKLLDIRGITFVKTGYCENYKNARWHDNSEIRKKTTKHNLDKQLNFFVELLKINKNIKIDPQLSEVVKNAEK